MKPGKCYLSHTVNYHEKNSPKRQLLFDFTPDNNLVRTFEDHSHESLLWDSLFKFEEC